MPNDIAKVTRKHKVTNQIREEIKYEYACCTDWFDQPLMSFAATAANDELVGTYNLLSGTRKLLDSGEVVDAYGGQHPKGSIIYSKEGRFLVMITWGRASETGEHRKDNRRAGR